MRRPILLLLAAITLLRYGTAHADAYVCTTKSGSHIRSDHFSPECRDVVTRVLYPDGALKETINPPETPAQIAARESSSKQAELESAIRDAQRNADRWLRDRYHSIKDIDDAWEQALADPKAAMMVAEATFNRLAKELKDLDREDEFYEKRKRPEELNEKYKTNAQATNQIIATMSAIRDQIATINKDFEWKRRRYAELDALLDNSHAAK